MSVRTTVLGFVSSAVVLTGVGLFSAGCPRSERPPWEYDAGPGQDAPDLSGVDTDGDGLCDPQEEMRGLRTDDPDTDGDGYSDLAEVSLGFDAFRPASPDRETIIVMAETAAGEGRVTIAVPVSGMGETFSGTFQPVPQIFPDGIDASHYYEASGPVGAVPMTNVYAIDAETQSFRGVHGRTQLVFEVRFRFAEPALGCMRAYPFQYLVKREDGRLVSAQRFTLVVAPSGQTPGAGTWCGASPCW